MLTTRRQALKTLTAAALASTALGRISASAQTGGADKPSTVSQRSTVPIGPFTLPALPYAYDALEPHIDAETMHLHHDKHHAGYVTKLNEAIAKDMSFKLSLGDKPDIDTLMENMASIPKSPRYSPGGSVGEESNGQVFASLPEALKLAIRNQGGGHANHSLFWLTLSPKSGQPSGEFATALDKEWGGLDKFKAEAVKAGGGVFGSGWVWLTLDPAKKLAIETTPNQDTPISEGKIPLFGIDVWEHAYYLKYHNLRADYITAIWNVVNWDFISDRYAKALKA